jgi:transposase
MHVVDVEIDDRQRLVLTIESGQVEAACPACGVLAVGHGRRVRVLHDAPCFARVTLLKWLVRIWRCREQLCATQTFTEAYDIAPSRMVLTTRAVGWATSALSWHHHRVGAGSAAGCGLAQTREYPTTGQTAAASGRNSTLIRE